MKNKWSAYLAAAMLGVVFNTSAALNLVTVDEQGNGSAFGNNMPGALWNPDPSPVANWVPQPWTFPDPKQTPWNGSVLVYQLPFLPTAGDVVLNEVGTAWSDVVRFLQYEDAQGLLKGLLVFYSDVGGPTGLPDGLADTPHAPVLLANWTSVNEVGPEGNNGASYTPLPGQPGYYVPVAGGPPVTYDLVSEVPEPATMIGGAMLLLPFAVSTIRILRRKN
jgi:hypothetical protein